MGDTRIIEIVVAKEKQLAKLLEDANSEAKSIIEESKTKAKAMLVVSSNEIEDIRKGLLEKESERRKIAIEKTKIDAEKTANAILKTADEKKNEVVELIKEQVLAVKPCK